MLGGPIDLYTEIPPGCVCTRECWNRILAAIEEQSEEGLSVIVYKCADHGAVHRFEMTSDGQSLVHHDDCFLQRA